MGAAVGSVSTLALGTRTNSTITAPSGITNGDILVICIIGGVNNGNDTGLVITPPANFNISVDGLNFNFEASDTYGVDMYVFWKIAASEAGNYTCTHTSGDTNAIMYRVTGGDQSTPLDPAPTTNVFIPPGTIGQTSTALSITPTVNDSLIIFFTACWNDSGPTTPPAGTTPTFTERFDPGNSGVIYAADGVLATAAATGNKSNTNGNSANNQPWGAILICVKAEAAADGALKTRKTLLGVGL